MEEFPISPSAITSIDADVQVDAKTGKYSFKTDKISLNNLKLSSTGFFQLVNDSVYNMDISFDAPSTDFKNILITDTCCFSKRFCYDENKRASYIQRVCKRNL